MYGWFMAEVAYHQFLLPLCNSHCSQGYILFIKEPLINLKLVALEHSRLQTILLRTFSGNTPLETYTLEISGYLILTKVFFVCFIDQKVSYLCLTHTWDIDESWYFL